MSRNIRDKNQVSPILRDLIPGSGGLGTGQFSTNGAETLTYNPNDAYWTAETGARVESENGTPISTR